MTCLREVRGGYWLALLVPACGIAAFVVHFPWAFVLGVVAVIPLLDALIGREKSPDNHAGRLMGAEIPGLYICEWAIALLVALSHARTASFAEWGGLVVGAGALSAFTMAHIHEVMHRRGKLTATLSDIAFVFAGYPHYRIAHRLHHAHVGDPRFGSTAEIDTSVWGHVGRSFASALRSSIESETQLGRRALRNKVWRLYGVSATVLAICWLWGGWRAGAFFIAQGAISAFVVEVIGYMQHYGLSKGVPAASIAWDVDYWLSNRLFVNNGLHTHHHLEQTKTYDMLEHAGPALPGGYLHMFGLALIPSMWFATMNPKLVARRANTEIQDPQD